jgi:capsular exopolysaccharide synthesis family protein
MVVSSVDPEEGKSVTAVNLAIAMARDGYRTILVDADLRRPSLHRMLAWAPAPGLTNVLGGAVDLHTALRAFPEVPGLRVITSGEIPGNPTELLDSAPMQELIERLAAEAEIVIFDSPPCAPVPDTAVLAPKVDGVLLVVDFREARRSGLKYATEQLDRAHARLLGLVCNKVSGHEGSSYYAYYFRRYYRRGYYADEPRGSGHGRSHAAAKGLPGSENGRALATHCAAAEEIRGE